MKGGIGILVNKSKCKYKKRKISYNYFKSVSVCRVVDYVLIVNAVIVNP
jgi:uncharacterized membrane protein YsdA (DUF1294 family)